VTSVAEAPPSLWAPLRREAFFALWLASFVSNIGTWMQTVGAQWFLVDHHSGSVLISLVQSASSLPALLLTLPAGVLAEFVDRRRMLIAVQAFQVVAGALMAALTLAGDMTPTLLLVLSFVLGCGAAAQLPSYQAFIPDLVPRSELGSAASLSSLGVNLARAVGPAIAGLLVTQLGVGGLFVLNAATFLVFALVLLRTHSPERKRPPRQAFLAGLEAGGRYVRNAPGVRRVLVRLVVFVWPANVLWALLAPVAHEQLGLGSSGYGLLLGAAGVGSVGGALLLPTLRRRLNPSWLIAGSGVIFGLAMLAIAFTHTTAVALIVLLPAGVGWIAVIASLNGMVQAFLPAWVRARALSIYQVVQFASFALSAALWGFVADWIGLSETFALAGALLLVGAVTVWRWPLRQLDPTGRDPVTIWTEPSVTLTPALTSAHVLISIRYTVPPENEDEFVTAMTALRRTRLRTGGTGWELYRDAEQAGGYVEQYTAVSWEDHLQQHRERITTYDQQAQERVDALASSIAPAEHLFEV
jgi:MFS family permease